MLFSLRVTKISLSSSPFLKFNGLVTISYMKGHFYFSTQCGFCFEIHPPCFDFEAGLTLCFFFPCFYPKLL